MKYCDNCNDKDMEIRDLKQQVIELESLLTFWENNSEKWKKDFNKLARKPYKSYESMD